MKRTKEQKQAYYQELHKQWKAAKELAETNEVKALYDEVKQMGIANISIGNVCMVYMQAQALGLDGLPYVDFKTYGEWRKSGYQVQKGEKSKVRTVTWINPKNENDENEDNGFRFPKATSLFHRSQVQEIQ